MSGLLKFFISSKKSRSIWLIAALDKVNFINNLFGLKLFKGSVEAPFKTGELILFVRERY